MLMMLMSDGCSGTKHGVNSSRATETTTPARRRRCGLRSIDRDQSPGLFILVTQSVEKFRSTLNPVIVVVFGK